MSSYVLSFIPFNFLTRCIFLLQRFSHALRIVEPVIELGFTGPHTVEGLYHTIYNMKEALEGRDADRKAIYERRSKLRHD